MEVAIEARNEDASAGCVAVYRNGKAARRNWTERQFPSVPRRSNVIRVGVSTVIV